MKSRLEEILAKSPNFDCAWLAELAERSALRQQADALVIEDLPDYETLELAVRAALRGVRVVAGLSALDVARALRLRLDRGVEPSALAHALRLVIAQHLLRRICPSCRTPDRAPAPAVVDALAMSPGDRCWRGAGCEACGGTGYRGRWRCSSRSRSTAGWSS